MANTVKVDFGEHGLEGQWAELRDPRFLSKRTIDRWQRAVQDGSLDEVAFLREFVHSWHLADADTGEAMNDPARDSIDGIPLVVFQVLNARVSDLFRASLAPARSDRPDLRVVDGGSGSPDAAA